MLDKQRPKQKIINITMRRTSNTSFTLILLLLTFCIFIPHYSFVKSVGNEGNSEKNGEAMNENRAKLRSEFDWRAYLEIYPDLAKHFSTREEAFFHYYKFGRKEGRRFPKIFPDQPSLGIAHRKLTNFIKQVEEDEIPVEDRTFVIYYVASLDHKYSLEVVVNNMRIFNSSIYHDTLPPSPPPSSSEDREVASTNTGKERRRSSNFYWFNIIGGADNILRPYIPIEFDNVAVAYWSLTPSEMFNHFRTIGLFKHTLETKFSSILFSNFMVRGPVLYRKSGEWLKQFRQVLYSNNNGIVGSTISCELSPHVQTHLFMIRNSIIPIIIAEYTIFRKFDDEVSLQRRYEVGLTALIQKNGYNISSIFTNKRLSQSSALVTASPSSPISLLALSAAPLPQGYFDGRCVAKPVEAKSADPTTWCDLKPEEVVFYRWGGDMLRSGYLCNEMKARMSVILEQIVNEEQQQLPVFFPESLNNGLYKEYDQEMWIDSRIAEKKQNSIKLEDLSYRVCFLVRTAQMHDIQPNRTLVESVEEDGIEGIIKSLFRQSDPNWGAFFFITDNRPFEKRLNEILSQFVDPRIEYIDIPMQYRPKYSPVDAGYTPTDYVLRKLVKREDCQWLSATNADNIYGSEIVRSVRQTLFNSQGKVPDMVLTPLDSRNFPEQDYRVRDTKGSWDQNCVGLVATFKFFELGYTVQPRPLVAKVDLAAVFFSRPRLLAENIFFDTQRFPCLGCQDGYFIEYLSRSRLWTYHRVPIDGMKSVVFHGPSPTWCLAAGNVWFDHPDVGGVRCYSQRIVDQIRSLDVQPNGIFDWKFFDANDRVCLRFTKLGFLKNAAELAKKEIVKKEPSL